MADMEIGQIIDYVEEYNKMHTAKNGKKPDKQSKEADTRRAATQSDWDALLG